MDNSSSPYANVKEYFTLLGVNLSVKARQFCEFFKVACRYYSNPLFRKVDCYLLFNYFMNSPFAISKEFLRKRGKEDIYTYGETPLTSLELIAKQCGISSKDKVFELGAGRGRACFWLRIFIGCDVVGIEYLPEFVKTANEIKKKFKISSIDFRFQDMMKADYASATVIYLYGTCLETSEIKQLIVQFSRLPRGTKIITVSYPLSAFDDKPSFETMKCFPVKYTWGIADVYLQIKK